MAKECVHRVRKYAFQDCSQSWKAYEIRYNASTRESANGQVAGNKGWALARKISPFCCRTGEPEASEQGSRPNLCRDKNFLFLPMMYTGAVENLGITSSFFPLLLIKRVFDIASNFDYNIVYIYYVRKSDRGKRQQNVSKTAKIFFNNWSAFLSFRCNANLGNAPGYF